MIYKIKQTNKQTTSNYYYTLLYHLNSIGLWVQINRFFWRHFWSLKYIALSLKHSREHIQTHLFKTRSTVLLAFHLDSYAVLYNVFDKCLTKTQSLKQTTIKSNYFYKLGLLFK